MSGATGAERRLAQDLQAADADWTGSGFEDYWLCQARAAMSGTPRPGPPNSYQQHPGHDLRQVPTTVLEAARAVLRQAAVWRDVDPEHAEGIADSVVGAMLPWLHLHERCAWVGTDQELPAGACQELTVGAMAYCQVHLDAHRERLGG